MPRHDQFGVYARVLSSFCIPREATSSNGSMVPALRCYREAMTLMGMVGECGGGAKIRVVRHMLDLID